MTMIRPHAMRDEMFAEAMARGDIEIRDDGTVWRTRSRGVVCTPRRIDTPKAKGYMSVALGVPGERRTVSMTAHRLVLMHAGVQIPDTMQVDHIDGNKANNRLENLDVVTASENMRRAYSNGRRKKTRHTRRKYDHDLIRSLRGEGLSLSQIAGRVGCSVSFASQLLSGKRG